MWQNFLQAGLSVKSSHPKRQKITPKLNDSSYAIRLFDKGKQRSAGSICAVGAEKHYVPSIGQERYLSGSEICRYLHLSCRTLQTLRDTRQITYTTVSKRLFLYPEKEITEILERNLKTAE